ncbi:acyl-CoA dehydrogenase [Vibrio stylophorae]|uniref:acyl-CoA dehydrogenase n=1 Tax=Vibrio stylophorae TaxID=659351 RepID=UPI001F2F2E72|nr:acyl-CoA dehydrogenase [Vibrio stylophorae]
MSQYRQRWLTQPVFRFFEKNLPPLSATETEAMEAGSVWWEGELFAGQPDWHQLHHYPAPVLSAAEQHFLDHEVETLLSMVDDYQITQDRDLPPEIWDFLKTHGFFALIIDPDFGGKGFSALANSTIVSRIATKSLSVAVTVMVPNSLGPGELLSHYGTQQQREYWLPRLAKGEDIPCFALTGPTAGSDAGSIPDRGVVCYGEYQGEQVLGVRLTWNKRYITLAPVATVLGLAFKMEDPDQLIGEETHLGITCALIPRSHPGVEMGDRHNPLGMAFMNGPTRGEDVFIPMDWLIGGQEYAGKGWRMLVECLSAGRGISLPALGAALGHLCARTTGAYSYIRQQFGHSIGVFEGVAEKIGHIGGTCYLLEAARTLTTTAIDLGEKPAVVTAIAKYHMTELARKVLNDSMDVHAGRAIQLGPLNYIGQAYFGMPVAITVEGANILTRNLMIFGQGATRCHPHVLPEIKAAALGEKKGLKHFDKIFVKHIQFSSKNLLMGLVNGLTRSRFNHAPVTGPTADYYRQLSRFSRALAVTSDWVMLALGGALKRKELISARLGDVLSHLYLGSAVLKHYEDQGSRKEDLPLVHYAMQYCLHQCAEAMHEMLRNFPAKGTALMLRVLLFPVGFHYAPPKDELLLEISQLLMKPGEQRDRLTHLCYHNMEKLDAVGLIDTCFIALYDAAPIERKIRLAVKSGQLTRLNDAFAQLEQAQEKGVINEREAQQLHQAYQLRMRAIQVDHFVDGFGADSARTPNMPLRKTS